MILDDDCEEKLDDSWINDFEIKDKPYNDFYKDNIFSININIIYIDKDNNIVKVNEENFLMQTPNIISREELLGIIKKNTVIDNNKYSLFSILRYNITLNPEDIDLFLNSSNFEYYNKFFLTSLKHIDTIVFDKSIITFQDLNTLFVIFYEKDKMNIANSTKKIFLNYKTKKHKTRRTS
jgi:hypothetical protein